MKTMPCPKCGTALNITGIAPGTSLTCPACGNMTAAPRSNRKVFIIIASAVGVLLLCPCVGLLAAIAVPNFIKFQARSKQAECKANLKAWYTAQRAYMIDKDTYSVSPADVGFMPERGNRYAYFAGPGPLDDRSGAPAEGGAPTMGFGVDTARYPGKAITFEQLPEDVATLVGPSGECPACEITLACAGQIDTDSTLDVWTLSTADREGSDGTPIPKGTPFQHVDDVTE